MIPNQLFLLGLVVLGRVAVLATLDLIHDPLRAWARRKPSLPAPPRLAAHCVLGWVSVVTPLIARPRAP